MSSIHQMEMGMQFKPEPYYLPGFTERIKTDSCTVKAYWGLAMNSWVAFQSIFSIRTGYDQFVFEWDGLVKM